MTKEQVETLKANLAATRDENHASAYLSAMAFVRTPTDAKSRDGALIDNATAEAFDNTINVINSIINSKQESGDG